MRCICLNQNKWRIFTKVLKAHLNIRFKFFLFVQFDSWFWIRKSLLILVINFSRITFKYHSIAVFWCLAPYQAKWLCQESLRDTIRSPFSLFTPLVVSCVWRLFLTKCTLKCSITKAWSISFTILKPSFFIYFPYN